MRSLRGPRPAGGPQPTALERQGNFSQTLDVNGKLIPITDTTTGAPFPGNVIPQNRLNPNGHALLNVLPLPNYTNRAITGGNYNYLIQEVQKDPKRSQLFKIDHVPTDKDRFFLRGKTWNAQQEGYAVAAGGTPVGFFGQCYCFTESGLGVGWTHVFNPNTVMEMNTGVRHNTRQTAFVIAGAGISGEIVYLPGGHILYVKSPGVPESAFGAQLWDIGIDERSGMPSENPRLITEWPEPIALLLPARMARGSLCAAMRSNTACMCSICH